MFSEVELARAGEIFEGMIRGAANDNADEIIQIVAEINRRFPTPVTDDTQSDEDELPPAEE